MADTLTEDIGPLPTWTWAAGGTLLLMGYLIYRKKQSMNSTAAQNTNQATGTSTNLGTVPISNLSVAAQPMPTQGGDTFVNVTNPPTNVTTPVNITNPPPPASSITPPPATNPQPATNPVQSSTPPGVPSGWEQIPNPSVGSEMAAAGVPWVTVGNAQYYNPAYVTHITSASQGGSLVSKGYKIITMNNAQYYNPMQAGHK